MDVYNSLCIYQYVADDAYLIISSSLCKQCLADKHINILQDISWAVEYFVRMKFQVINEQKKRTMRAGSPLLAREKLICIICY